MKRRQWLLVLILVLGYRTALQGAERFSRMSAADWTVMVYVNGANNSLERPALCTLYELLSLETNSRVNVVVQLSLTGNAPTATHGTVPAPCTMIGNNHLLIRYWRGTRRFAVKNHVIVNKTVPHFSDLGDPRSLSSFVKWGRDHYPARHYMLDLWGHGEGRFLLAELTKAGKINGTPDIASFPDIRTLDQDFLKTDAVSPDQTELLHFFNDSSFVSMYKKDGNHILLNTEIRRSLRKALWNTKLDLIGFDACYKGMLETAYAMGGIAKIMVASEEGEPGKGWNNNDWLRKLHAEPGIDGAKLGGVLVQSYRDTYLNDHEPTSQAAMSLTSVNRLSRRLDDLARLLIDHPDLWQSVAEARSQVTAYQFHEVDLGQFLTLLLRVVEKKPRQTKRELILALQLLTKEIQSFIIPPPFANKKSVDCHGSTGLAIYFPATKAEYQYDPDHKFYDPDRRSAIPFAHHNKWARFLKSYLFAGITVEKSVVQPIPCS
jgi:hypothetical protein